MYTCIELQKKHELKMQALRDELELRRKTEVHEIEEVRIDTFSTRAVYMNHYFSVRTVKSIL